MTQEATNLLTGYQVDPRVLAITTNTAVGMAYGMWVIDTETDIDGSRGQALKLVADFDATVEAFPIASRERIYLNTIRMAAIDLARGLGRRQADKKERLQVVRERKDIMLKHYAFNEMIMGLARGGFKLLILGGAFLFVANTWFGLQLAPGKAHGVDWTAVATVVGIAMLGAFLRSWTVLRRLPKIFKQFQDDWEKVQKEYRDSVLTEYRLAAETANLAWRQLTGMDSPPTTRAVEGLLRAVIDSDADSPRAAELRPQLQNRWWWLQPSNWKSPTAA